MEHILIDSDYLHLWKRYSGLRQTSLNSYMSYLRKFEFFLIQIKKFEGSLDFDKFTYYVDDNLYSPITEGFINEYIQYLKNECKATRSTLYANISALSNFFTFLKDMRVIKLNPMAHYKNPFYDPKINDRSLSKNDCGLLLEASVKVDPFFRVIYVLVLLMVTTGLRNKEIRELTIGQIDFGRNIIYVDQGQKTTANSVYMSTILTFELRRLINHPLHKSWQTNGNISVFFRSNGRKFTTLTINEILKELCVVAGIKKITAHCLRHTMASLLLDSGVDVSIIQRQLRHKDMETTLRYLPQITDVEMLAQDFDL
ncbi:site-specific integrase [Paenibacillus sp. WQ 127069]|uniref:Site-specific integrase n=1 Tax=Paenibacillus baimaensis TaxID=2982185 RepID=A0ABT2UQ84_9BACL|nr:site-specific integrase [Paenibacillus sp. WQ 127069]MCU6796819.1 site-specific integrase [Paenibacillus sp. WQ 127069]